MSKIYNASGGYRRLHSLAFTWIINLATARFCKRYIRWGKPPAR
jgi:hypothetical protein